MAEIIPIAYIKTDFKEKFGIPRQSGMVNSLAKIVFEKEFRNPEALRGIEEFSHLWIIFDFSFNHSEKWSATVRPPRLGGNERKGVFASRSPFRPNSLGLSCVKLEKLEKNETFGTYLVVSGADCLDNTPIFDIKPYIPYCDCKNNAEGSYAEENKNYKLEVIFNNNLLNIIPKNKQQVIIDCLAQDPRPSYHDDDKKIYYFKFDIFEISFVIKKQKLIVLDVKEK